MGKLMSPVQFGVPQGSILGPHLSLYIPMILVQLSQLCKLIFMQMTLPCCCFYASKSLDDINKTCMVQIIDFTNTDRLTLNVSKSKAMFFGSAQKLVTAGSPGLGLFLSVSKANNMNVFKIAIFLLNAMLMVDTIVVHLLRETWF